MTAQEVRTKLGRSIKAPRSALPYEEERRVADNQRLIMEALRHLIEPLANAEDAPRPRPPTNSFMTEY